MAAACSAGQVGGTRNVVACAPHALRPWHAPPCLQVGPGVKGLAENDWVVPLGPGLGTWRSLAGETDAGCLRDRTNDWFD